PSSPPSCSPPGSGTWPSDPKYVAAMGLTGSAWAADTSEPVLETTVGGVLRQAAEAAPGRVGLVAARIDPSLRRRWAFEEALAEELRPDLPDLRDVVTFAEWREFCASGSSTEHLPHVQPDDAAQIQYTSGTTGFPKGALLRHRGITNNARFCAERLRVEEGASWVNPMPLFHTGGCVLGTLGPLQRGATEVLIEAFEPGLVLEQVEAERAQILGGV